MNRVTRGAAIVFMSQALVGTGLGADPFGGAWFVLPELQLARQEVAVAVFEERVWVLGGQVGGDTPVATETNEVWSLDQSAWDWGPPLPAPRDHLAVAVHDGRLWVLGGYDLVGLPQDTVWSIGSGEVEWLVEASLPQPIAAAGAASVGGRLLLFGGRPDTQATSAAWRYLEDGTGWEPIAPLGVARDHLGTAVLGGKVYALGGRGPTGPTLGTVERYDPVMNSWTPRSDLPTPRSALAAAASGGLVWTAGGELPGIFDEVEVYDPSTDQWESGPAMPTARHGTGMVVLGGALVVPAGSDAPFSSPSSVVEALRPDHLFRDGFEAGDTSFWSPQE